MTEIFLKGNIETKPEVQGDYITFYLSSGLNFPKGNEKIAFPTSYCILIKKRTKKQLVHIRRAFRHSFGLNITGFLDGFMENRTTSRMVLAKHVEIINYYMYY